MNKHYYYWVDFESWGIEAESEDDADKIVKERIKNKEYPAISNIELQDNNDIKVEGVDDE
jgi:hypothetical protein